MATIFLNDGFVNREDARVSAFDAGFQHAVGLFETMTGVRDPQPRILHVFEHISRLAESARSLGLAESIRVNPLVEACERTLMKACEEHESSRFRIRLSITAGDLNLLDRGTNQRELTPTLLIVAQPATVYPDVMFEKGVAIGVADFKANPLDPTQGHKTVNYWARLRELQIAAGRGAAEALVLQVSNHLCGGCVSNVFVAKNGRVMTPIARGEESEVAGINPDSPSSGPTPIPSPVLPGVTRRWVLDRCHGFDIDTERRMLSIADVLDADEVFLTNSSWGVLPIIAIEQRSIGAGRPGPITGELVAAWRELFE
jgi:branched-chain amino acid aminotransferase